MWQVVSAIALRHRNRAGDGPSLGGGCYVAGTSAREPGGPMRQRRTLFWIIIGSAVAVAIVLAVIHLTSGTPATAASSSAPPVSTGAGSQAGEPVPVVTPQTSGTTSYLADLTPSGDLAGSVVRGPVNIAGSMYPKSISFYCNVGDATAFPVYTPKHGARRFQATIGLPATSSPEFQATVLLVSGGHTLRT